MLISVHLPKTGGSSFKELLQSNYGRSYTEDYHDTPINKTITERTKDVKEFDEKFNILNRNYLRLKGVKCIHGHFLPYKYKKLLKSKNIQFITWIREPTERLISHYYYWQRSYNKSSATLHKRVFEESWSLEQFCLAPELKNFYGKFLWNFPIENFDFIGITEFYQSDLSYFSKKFLKVPIENFNLKKINVNPDKKGRYSESISTELLSEIKDYHASDYELYQRALIIRMERIHNDL